MPVCRTRTATICGGSPGRMPSRSPPWFLLFPVLSGTALTALLLTLFWPALLPVLAGVIVLNIGVRYATDRRIDALVVVFRQLAPVVAAGESLRFLQGADVEPLIGPLGSDVARLRRLKTIARWVSGDPLMVSFSGSALQQVFTEIANALYVYVNLFFLIEASGVFAGARDLRAHGPSLVRVVSAIGDVDAAQSVASYRAGRDDWTRPQFRAAGTPVLLGDIRHPLVADAVPNTMTIEPGRGLLVTGSNMSGKSTFLRTVGVTAALAQTIHTRLATRDQAPVLNLRSCVGQIRRPARRQELLTLSKSRSCSISSGRAEARRRTCSCSTSFSGARTRWNESPRGTRCCAELVTGRDGSAPHMVIAATHDGELVDSAARGTPPVISAPWLAATDSRSTTGSGRVPRPLETPSRCCASTARPSRCGLRRDDCRSARPSTPPGLGLTTRRRACRAGSTRVALLGFVLLRVAVDLLSGRRAETRSMLPIVNHGYVGGRPRRRTSESSCCQRVAAVDVEEEPVRRGE